MFFYFYTQTDVNEPHVLIQNEIGVAHYIVRFRSNDAIQTGVSRNKRFEFFARDSHLLHASDGLRLLLILLLLF